MAIKLLPQGDFVKNYQLYVRREIQNQSSLRHPLIVSLREVYNCNARHGHLSSSVKVCRTASLLHHFQQPHGAGPRQSTGTADGLDMTNWQTMLPVPGILPMNSMICVQARIVAEQVFLTPTHLAIAMEYAQGGDLFNYTLGHRPHGRLAEQQARWIFQQLIIGLDYCHRRVSMALGSPVHLGSACTTRAVMRNAEGRPIQSKWSHRPHGCHAI